MLLASVPSALGNLLIELITLRYLPPRPRNEPIAILSFIMPTTARLPLFSQFCLLTEGSAPRGFFFRLPTWLITRHLIVRDPGRQMINFPMGYPEIALSLNAQTLLPGDPQGRATLAILQPGYMVHYNGPHSKQGRGCPEPTAVPMTHISGSAFQQPGRRGLLYFWVPLHLLEFCPVHPGGPAGDDFLLPASTARWRLCLSFPCSFCSPGFFHVPHVTEFGALPCSS